MKKLTLLGGRLALAAALLLGISSNASATLIDDFSVDQAAISTSGGLVVAPEVCSVTGIIGGCRDLSILAPSPDGDPIIDPPEATAGVAGGRLNISNDFDISSIVTVTWDGAGTGVGAAGLGLAGDLSTTLALVVQVFSADLPSSIEFVLSDGTNVASKVLSLPSGSGQYVFALNSFTSAPGSLTLSSIESIKMIISSDAVSPELDMRIDFVETSEVPEPSTMLLSGSALLALGLLRKRIGVKA